MAEEADPGPSSAKLSRLSTHELLELLYASDSDKEYAANDVSDSEWETESGGIFVMTSDEVQDTDIVPNIDYLNWGWSPTQIKDLPFLGQTGLAVPFPESGKPIDYFYLLLGEDFLDSVVSATNAYANILKAGNLPPKSEMHYWKELDKEELRIFFGLALHMGSIRLPRTNDYWMTHRLYRIPCFREFMGRNRFRVILKCLYFSRNLTEGESNPVDQLHKIKPVLDYFNRKMKKIYFPTKELSLDEPVTFGENRMFQSQNRRSKQEFKLHLLTEPSGIVINMAMHSGDLKSCSENIVLHLMKDRLDAGHSLYMDSFYSSYDIAVKLLQKGTYCTGILSNSSKDLPYDVLNAQLNTDQSVCLYSNGVGIGKWRDMEEEVFFISTEHKNKNVQTRDKKGLFRSKPKPVVEHNKSMSGADFQHQMQSFCSDVISATGWYKQMAIHLIEMMLFNSFKLHCKNSSKKIMYCDYRLAVIEELLPENCTLEQKKAEPTASKKGDHFPAKHVSMGEIRKTIRKKCRQCYKNKKRKDTIYYCKKCPGEPGLCLECFKIYHGTLNPT